MKNYTQKYLIKPTVPHNAARKIHFRTQRLEKFHAQVLIFPFMQT